MSISYLGDLYDPLVTHNEQRLRLGTACEDSLGRVWSYVKFYKSVLCGQYVRDLITSDLNISYADAMVEDTDGDDISWVNPSNGVLDVLGVEAVGTTSVELSAATEVNERYVGAYGWVSAGTGSGQMFWVRAIDGQSLVVEVLSGRFNARGDTANKENSSGKIRGWDTALSGAGGSPTKIVLTAPGKVVEGPYAIEPESATDIIGNPPDQIPGRNYTIVRGICQAAVTVSAEGEEPYGWVLQKGLGWALCDYNRTIAKDVHGMSTAGNRLFIGKQGRVGGLLFHNSDNEDDATPNLHGGAAGAATADTWDEFARDRVREYVRYAGSATSVGYVAMSPPPDENTSTPKLVPLIVDINNPGTSFEPAGAVHPRNVTDVT